MCENCLLLAEKIRKTVDPFAQNALGNIEMNFFFLLFLFQSSKRMTDIVLCASNVGIFGFSLK